MSFWPWSRHFFLPVETRCGYQNVIGRASVSLFCQIIFTVCYERQSRIPEVENCINNALPGSKQSWTRPFSRCYTRVMQVWCRHCRTIAVVTFLIVRGVLVFGARALVTPYRRSFPPSLCPGSKIDFWHGLNDARTSTRRLADWSL